MALSYRAQRTLQNAFGRALHEPRQLLALLVVVGYAAINIGIVIALLVFPFPLPLRVLAERLVPGGVVAQLAGVQGTLTLILLSLAASAAFENPLLQFGQADIDLLFPTPIPPRRLLLNRVLTNHLRAFAAAFFFWGLSIAPLLRLGGFAIWPAGALSLLALTCTFAIVDQITASGLLWLHSRNADRWLARAGLVLVALALCATIGACIARLITGNWAVLSALLGFASGTLGVVVFPIGLAVEVLLAAVRDTSAELQTGLLLGFDLLSAVLVVVIGQGRIQELAVSPHGQGGLLMRAARSARLNPLRFAQLAWNPERIHAEPHTVYSGIRPFGTGALVLSWARLVQLWRNLPRTLLALVVLGLFPLAIILQNRAFGMSAMVSAIIFSASLATQLFHELRDHLTGVDTDLSLPIPRWRLLFASLLAHLPLYWLGGLILIAGTLIARGGQEWPTALGLAFWYPLVIIPQIAMRGAVMFLFPAAVLPGRRDPVQFMVVALVNGLVTIAMLILALTPIGALLLLADRIQIDLAVVFLVLYLCNGLLSAGALLLLAWAYGRFEPEEGG
jgi:Putative ABC exporter